MVLCLGEPPERFLLLLFLFFILLLLFFISFPGYFTMSPALHPGFSGPQAPTSSELYPDYFWLPLLFHLPRALRFWVGVFYPQAFFTLRSFTNIFDSTCVYQGLTGSRQFYLEICKASYWSSKHRPSSSVCLIHSNPQSSYSEEFIFKFYHILSWITCGKNFFFLCGHIGPPPAAKMPWGCGKNFSFELVLVSELV